jgi:DnaJ-class molecular chaperone
MATTTQSKPCPSCNGSGVIVHRQWSEILGRMVDNPKDCHICHHTGYIQVEIIIHSSSVSGKPR